MQGIDVKELKNVYKSGFPDDTDGYVDFFFDRYVAPENIVAYSENGKIISAGYIIEKPAEIFGKRTVFPYVTALSTLPEYRGYGKIKFVLSKAFDIMRSRGYSFFGLHPFDYKYYKRFGLENISYACHSTVSGGENYEVRSCKESDFATVSDIYHNMSSRFGNKLLLTKDTFMLKAGEYAADGIECKLLFDNGKCFAFAFVDKGNIDFYATTDMRRFSRAECFKNLSYCDFYESDEPYLQGRVIDAKKAAFEYFSANPPENEVCFAVKDGLIAENNICISVKSENRNIVIKDCKYAENTYDIGEFTRKIFCKAANFFPDKY